MHFYSVSLLFFLQYAFGPLQMNGEPEEENLNKSEISQVFEIALKRNLPVNFEVIYTFLCHLSLEYINSVM